MKIPWNRRKSAVIKKLKCYLWPLVKKMFRLEISGTEEILQRPTLYVANHNIGALIESHSILFEIDEKFQERHIVFGFTHPSIFRIWGIKNYFEWIGAVPATYEVAKDVFQSGHSILIFPGGNKQALRSLFDYKKNAFRDSHGWAKIAKENEVDVVPITFNGSHFVNPVFFQSALLAKLLIFPWLLGVKWISVSLSQILITGLMVFLMNTLHLSLWIIVPISVLTFCLNSLTFILPFKIKMRILPRIQTKTLSQEQLEEKVGNIMDQIYND